MFSKLIEYRDDYKAPNKNLPIIKQTLQKIEEIFDSQLSGTIPSALIQGAKLSFSKIDELSKLRTQNRANEIFKLAQLANMISAPLKEGKIDVYLKVQITNFLLELKLAPEEMKNSSIPGLASGIIGIGLAAFPVWSYLAIIIGAYHLLQRDYRNRLIGIVVLGAVIVGIIVNYLLIQ